MNEDEFTEASSFEMPRGEREQNSSMNAEELIQTTVRAILVYNNETRQQRDTGNETRQRNYPKLNYSNKEIAVLLSDFSGTNENINLWLERVDSIQRVYQVPDEIMQLIAVGKLTQRAKEWYQSKVEFVSMNWNALKNEMRKMFFIETDPVTLRREMEKRRWRKTEKFSAYFHDKVLLGNNAEVPEREMMHYIIEGFDDKLLQNQARMLINQMNSLEDLFSTMNNVVREDHLPMRNSSRATSSNNAQTSQKQTHKPSLRCFNCNQEGHASRV